MIILNVYYNAKPGKRDEFYSEVKALGVPEGSRAEEGNIKYDYYFSDTDENQILLVEHWKDEEAFKFHCQQDYFKKLQDIKSEYIAEARIDRFEI
ncbi:MAG: putative quinol monooxygenase [Eubacteriales bacterium]|nr:putative quinol monooxygenase [Eubacteriales bacterium]